MVNSELGGFSIEQSALQDRMRKKSIPILLLKSALAVIGSIAGIIIAGLVYEILLPFWTVTSIGQAIDGATDILFVDYKYWEGTQLENNTLFIQTQSGDVYSVDQDRRHPISRLPDGQTISQIWLQDWDADAPIIAVTDQGNDYQLVDDQWELVENPTNEFKGFTPRTCADQWYLPVFGVTDSAGTVFSHALANEYVCYVLFSDGRLQVWRRTQDAFSLMGSLALGAVIGLVVGLNALPIWNRFNHKRVKQPL